MNIISYETRGIIIPIFINLEGYKLLFSWNVGKTRFKCHQHGKLSTYPFHKGCMYWEYLFIFYSENPLVIYEL